jgi:hypothetical protein
MLRSGSKMMRTPIIERAYQLADSGYHASTRGIEAMLYKEGYELVGTHLEGSQIRAALLQRIRAARDPTGRNRKNPSDRGPRKSECPQ